MTAQVTKLIAEYEIKISLMDQVIERETQFIRALRTEDLTTMEYIERTAPFLTDRKIAEAKRQAYVQFISDLTTI